MIEQPKDFLLAAMRCARLRLQLLQAELDAVGLALKRNLIGHDDGVLWLDECGLLPFIDIEIKQEATKDIA